MGFLAIALAGSGCSWVPRARTLREGERLELQSAVVTAPADPGWRGRRTFDAGARELDLAHRSENGAWDRFITLREADGALALPSREYVLAELSRAARARLGDPAAEIEEIPAAPPGRFGGSAIAVALRAEESDAKAGASGRRCLHSAMLVFVSPAGGDRTTAIHYAEATSGSPSSRPEEAWAALLEGVELRPATPANVEAAAARGDDFPKTFEPGLARRSLTLPQSGFQALFHGERWLAPGGASTPSVGLAFGVTDHLELDTPGFLRYAFGEAEALTRPEVAVGGGLTGYDHDAAHGSVWGFGATAEARRRLAAEVALRVQTLVEGVHESRTGRTRPGGQVAAGVVWDVNRYATLGVEAGWESRPWKDANSEVVWVGGRGTPLLTIHVPFVDLGLTGAVAWDHGRPGVLAGFGVLLTL
jgi:hypothetical protein